MITDLDNFYKLYSIILEDTDNIESELCTFFPQVGPKYFDSKKRILFVGKAVNGWITKDRNVDNLFDISNEWRIVNRHDQLEWVHNLEGNREQYNTKKSAFWRVIKNISCQVHGAEEWYSHIGWSNLYKLSPWDGGNPNAHTRRLQQKHCVEILEEEIRVLQPHVIVFLTSGWEDFFISSLERFPMKGNSITWDKYATHYTEYKGISVIQSHHPQGKKERPHADAIALIIKGNLDN